MEDIIQKIKDHPQFVFADSDDELISIIDDINPGLTQRQKFEIINDLENLERSGSRKGSTVQQVVDAFEDIDNTSNDKLFQLAKDLPDGLGDEVIEALGVGLWRGDEPDEKEFFRIIESKFPRQGSRKGQDFTAEGIKNVANAFKDITTNKIPDAIGKMKEERDGSRKGTGPLCDLGSVSGKGSRPDNLDSIASKVSLGRNRSINMDGGYIEQ